MRVDRALVIAVESNAARHGARLVDALATVTGDGVPTHRALDSGELLSMGAGRFVNRGVGLGFGDVAPHDLVDEVEEFYRSRGLLPMMEVDPWIDGELRQVLRDRTWVVDWFRNVYAMPLDDIDVDVPCPAEIRDVDDEMVTSWSAILGGDTPLDSVDRRVSDEFCLAARQIPGSIDLATVVDGHAVACGSLVVVDEIGWIGAAATLAARRGQGLQTALIHERLRRAKGAGCELAAATALPDGASARNLAAIGFTLLSTQAVMSPVV